jgi:hypothetical protein
VAVGSVTLGYFGCEKIAGGNRFEIHISTSEVTTFSSADINNEQEDV